jgi:hypothetical protein
MADLESILREIREEQGRLTPQSVVDAARPIDSELHSHFEWDDAIGAEMNRLSQARRLIRTVRVTHITEEDVPIRVRTFHSVQRNGGRSYEPLDEIIQEPLTMRLLLAAMRRDYVMLRQRYEHMTEFWDMIRGEADSHESDLG